MGEPIIKSEEYGRDLPRDVWQMLVIRDAHIKELEKRSVPPWLGEAIEVVDAAYVFGWRDELRARAKVLLKEMRALAGEEDKS